VTYRQLFELQPFGNNMVKASVTGRVIRLALEHAVAGGHPDAHIAGMTATFDRTRPDGRRIVSVQVHGKPLRDDKTYTIAVNDFMSTGGSGFTMFSGLGWRVTGLTDLDALVQWLGRQKSPVRADTTVRISPIAK
jgi:5'-nucleotidase